MGFWTGLALGACLVLVAIALLLGLGMVWWRLFWDGTLGHAWREEWGETVRRWRFW